MEDKLRTSYRRDEKLEPIFKGGTIKICPSGEVMFSPCDDEVKVVTVATGLVVKTLEGDGEPIMSVCISPDNEYLVTASRSRMLRVWNWQSSTVIRAYKAHDGPVVSMDIEGTSTLLATGSADSTIKVWDLRQGFATHNFRGSTGVVSTVKFHPDQDKLWLVSASDDYKVRIWDLKAKKCIAALDSHVSLVRGIAFSPDQSLLFSGGRDKVVTVWDLESFKLVKTFPVFETLESVVTLPEDENNGDEIQFLTVGDKGKIRVFSYPSGSCVFEDTEAFPRPMKDAFIASLPEPTLVTVTFDNDIILQSIPKDGEMTVNKQITGFYDEVIDLQHLDENKRIAVATNTEEIKVTELATSNSQCLRGHSDIVLCLDASKDGRFLVSSSKDNTVRCWSKDEDTDLYFCLGVGVGHAEAVGAVSFSRRRNTFIVSGSKDTTVKLWELSPLEEATFGGQPVALTAKFTRKAHDKDINSISVAPNDKILATGSQDRTAKLWQTSDGTLMTTLKGHKRGVWCVQFSPVDQVLATSSADTTIKLWSLADFSCVKTFEGHSHSVLKCAFISKGMQLLSCGSEGVMKLWTIKTNVLVDSFDEHTDKVWAMSTCDDGDSVVTGGSDATIVMWRDDTQEKEDAQSAEREKEILLVQELSNHLAKKEYKKAIIIAIKLRQPRRMLTLVKTILALENGLSTLDDVISGLTTGDINEVLAFAAEWNTNTTHSWASQTVANIILRKFSAAQLQELPDIKQTLRALIAYSERHFQRLTRTMQEATLLDFVWHAIELPDQKDGSEPAFMNGMNGVSHNHVDGDGDESNESDESGDDDSSGGDSNSMDEDDDDDGDDDDDDGDNDDEEDGESDDDESDDADEGGNDSPMEEDDTKASNTQSLRKRKSREAEVTKPRATRAKRNKSSDRRKSKTPKKTEATQSGPTRRSTRRSARK